MAGHSASKCLKYILTFIFWILTIRFAAAQVPHHGIFRLLSGSYNGLSIDFYSRYLYDLGQYFDVNFVPEKEVETYNLTYALVSVDTVNKLMKVAFLPDSVSTAGQVKWQKLKAENSQYNSLPESFAQTYSLSSDSVGTKLRYLDRFPIGGGGLNGTAICAQVLDGLMAFMILPPGKQSVQRYDSISKSYQSGRVYTFEQSFFSPFGAAPYKELRYTDELDSVPIYKRPRMAAKSYHYFRQKEYVAVLKDSANWLKVQKAEVVADSQTYYIPDGGGLVKGESQLRLISGWVKKGDLAPYPWLKQKQGTKDFRFEVSGYARDTTEWQDEGEVYGIKIINKKSGNVQVLDNIGAAVADKLNDVVQVQDCNFDGYPDIWIYAHNGGAGPNDGNNYYLYNPRNGQFEFNQNLSDLTQISVDTKSKTITSAFRDGAGHHGGGTYTFTHDTLTQITSWDDYCMGSFFCTFSTGTLMNGHWQDSVAYTLYLSDSNIQVLARPEDNSVATGTLAPGYETTIVRERPLWFFLEGTDKQNQLVRGWAKKENILPKQWLSFKIGKGKFHFFAATPDSSEVVAIGIQSSTGGNFKQIIPVYQPLYYTDSLLQTGDYNHDGYVDFRLVVNEDREPAVYQYYLFNAQSGMFEQEKERAGE